MKISKLKNKYENICNKYISLFCIKQEMDFEGWIGDDIGGIAYCNDFFFNFSDIVLDINTNQPKGKIIDWYYDNLESTDNSINYYSYIKGLRVKELISVT